MYKSEGLGSGSVWYGRLGSCPSMGSGPFLHVRVVFFFLPNYTYYNYRRMSYDSSSAEVVYSNRLLRIVNKPS